MYRKVKLAIPQKNLSVGLIVLEQHLAILQVQCGAQ